MESQHMTQQVFADFVGIAPATLSGIFTERTKPTINTVEAIKKKLPTISTDWLMFGKGTMYDDGKSDSPTSDEVNTLYNGDSPRSGESSLIFDFDPSSSQMPQSGVRPSNNQNSVKNTRSESNVENMKNLDKTPRRVTEIRVFYDDQTWESFVPEKK